MRQRARCIQQRKVFLVGFHREDQAFGRHGQELGLELRQQHVGPLDKGRDFVEQRVVVGKFQALRFSRCKQLAQNFSAALGEAGDHRALVTQLLRVAVGGPDRQRRRGGLETVALGGATRFQTQCADLHHLVAMQRHQAMCRAHKADAAPAVGQLVLHDFRDRQCRQRGRQCALQAGRQLHAGSHAVQEQRVGFAVDLTAQAWHGAGVFTQRGQFLQQHRGGAAVGTQAHRHGHQLVQHRLVERGSPHGTDVRGQAARRREHCQHRCVTGQSLHPQVTQQLPAKRFPQPLQGLRRQLFNEQLDQQILCGSHR